MHCGHGQGQTLYKYKNLIEVCVLQLEAHLNGAHLTIFQGTSYLYKAVPQPSLQEDEKYRAVPLPSSQQDENLAVE